MNPRILVVVVTYNPKKWVDKCLGSLRASSYPVDTFLIDNGSSDGGQYYIQENFPEVIFVQSNTNLGFGKANNVGLRYALDHGYDYVYLLNQDAWVREDTIAQLIEAFKSDSLWGILSPLQLEGSEKRLEKNFYNFSGLSFVDITNVQTPKGLTVKEVPFAQAAHWMIPKSCLSCVGGFSPSFTHYGEDNNFIDRMKYHGYKIGVVTNAVGIHDCEQREESNSDKRIAYLSYCSALVTLSAPEGKANIFHIIKTFLYLSINKHNIYYISFIFRLISEYSFIKRNKEYSKIGFSFL